MPYNSETETFYQAPATVVDSTPDGDTVQEGFDDRLTPAMAGLYADLNLLKADGMISVGIPATTTSRGIGRVATAADMAPGAVVENGPAFLDATGGVITTTPTAHAVPRAGADGKINKNWLSLDPQFNPQPSTSGTSSFTSSTNTITMTGIVTTLGLEVGDVVIFGGSANTTNAKLRTVEAITNNNTIVVNYEHCGNRGNGSLKLSDQSGVSVTCTRIAKWYNAPIGLGQAWVDVTTSRAVNTVYASPKNRSMGWYLTGSSGPGGTITVDNISLSAGTTPTGGWSATGHQNYIELSGEATYRTNIGGIYTWGERR